MVNSLRQLYYGLTDMELDIKFVYTEDFNTANKQMYTVC